jgi:cytochrome P450
VRRCIGAAFAEFEMRVVLSAVLRRCEVRAAAKRPEKIARRNITFSPKNGTRIAVRHMLA